MVSTHSRPKAAGNQFITACENILVSTHSRPKAAGEVIVPLRAILNRFQLTAARRRLGVAKPPMPTQPGCFNSQPPEGGWSRRCGGSCGSGMFQLTAARRRLGSYRPTPGNTQSVSTHSRPKAAGFYRVSARYFLACFNSQPPEGGWWPKSAPRHLVWQFQLTAARRRLASELSAITTKSPFQLTAARRRLAAAPIRLRAPLRFQLTAARRRLACSLASARAAQRFQLTAARRRLVISFGLPWRVKHVSTHSRPKAAGTELGGLKSSIGVSTHSRPKAAGNVRTTATGNYGEFQLTAARRRLGRFNIGCLADITVSTHSRPKAAGKKSWLALKYGVFQLTAARRRLAALLQLSCAKRCFNSQPPEGGWPLPSPLPAIVSRFNSQPPEGGWS